MTSVQDASLPLTDPDRVRNARIYEIEQALKREPDHAYRRELVREYLDLTNPAIQEPDL